LNFTVTTKEVRQLYLNHVNQRSKSQVLLLD